VSKKIPISAVKAVLDDAKTAYKAKFTPGYYHGSPSPNIKAFDPSKTNKDITDTVPGVSFVTQNPNFAESFLPMSNPKQFKTGATMYPVNVNLGKHFDADTPEGQALIRSYAGNSPLGERLMESAWTEMESPAFLDYLKKRGFETFKVKEGGVENVGVLKPQNIRGKFAEFNPEFADSPDIMKKEGGSVELTPEILDFLFTHHLR
jgi:hypothetical protein